MSTTDQAFIRAYAPRPAGPRSLSSQAEMEGAAPPVPAPALPADAPAVRRSRHVPPLEWQPLVQFVSAVQNEQDESGDGTAAASQQTETQQASLDTVADASVAVHARHGIVRWDEHPPNPSERGFANHSAAEPPSDSSQVYGRADGYDGAADEDSAAAPAAARAASATQTGQTTAATSTESPPASNPPHFRPRRPLSFFTQPTLSANQSSLGRQVESFAWPEVCVEITQQCRTQLAELARLLGADLQEGRNCIALASGSPGSGTTTIALSLAKSLADSERKILLIDADTARPSVAAQLQVEPHATLQEVLEGVAPLDEVVIHSTTDRISILPICEGRAADSTIVQPSQAAAVLTSLHEAYDLVLLDLGHALDGSRYTDTQVLLAALRPDAAFAVANSESAERMQADQAEQIFRKAGCRFLGTIETFTTDSTLAYA